MSALPAPRGPLLSPRPDRSVNLSGWLHEPYVQDVIVRMLVEAEYALVLRDFVCTGGIPVASASRVLGRLHGRGLVSRCKLPMHRHIYSRKLGACIPGGAVRAVWAYTWIGG